MLFDARSPDPAILSLARRAEAIEAAAWADSLEAVSDPSLGAEVARIGDATLVCVRSISAPMFQKVSGLGLERPVTDALVRSILEWYAAREIAHFWVQPSPAAEPPDLFGSLAIFGLLPTGSRWGKFVFRGATPRDESETDLAISEAGAEDAEAFSAVAREGFGMPPALDSWLRALPGREGWRVYVAYDGKEPAACGATFVRNGAAWIGFGATRPAHRKRGGQRALLARRIRDARDAGCDVIVTETGVDREGGPGPSWRNITHVGFELLYERPNLALVESDDRSAERASASRSGG